MADFASSKVWGDLFVTKNLTLGGPLLDTNGKVLFAFTATAEAVNYLTLKNEATTASPGLTAVGADTNISIDLIPKGTGRLQVAGITVPTISSTDTLTNKTLTSPVIASITGPVTISQSGAEPLALYRSVATANVVVRYYNTVGSVYAGGRIDAADNRSFSIGAGLDLSTAAFKMNIDSGLMTVAGNIESGTIRPISLKSSVGAVEIKGSAGGWANGYFFTGSAGTSLYGYGAYGTADAFTFLYMGGPYTDPHWKIDTSGNGELKGNLTVTGPGTHAFNGNIAFDGYLGEGKVNFSVDSSTTVHLLDSGNTLRGGALTLTHDGSGAVRYSLSTRSSTTITPRLTVRETGNVGIGTVVPTEKLHVVGNILTTGTLNVQGTGTSSIAGNLSLGTPGAGATRYGPLLADATGTFDGRLAMQAGGGSAGFGGALNLYGHSHASRPGYVVVGLSSGAAAKFVVNTHGLDTGADVFSVDTSGNVLASGTITATLAGTATRATNLVGGNNTTLLGSIPYQSDTDITTLLAPNTTVDRRFLRMTGTGANGAAPVWDSMIAGDIPTLNQNTTGSAAKITTPVAIYGNNFDGSAALTQVIGMTYGGTGLSTIAAGSILYANALDTLTALKPAAANQVLRSTPGLMAQFASLVALDIPSLDTAKITSGTFDAARLTGTYSININGSAATLTDARTINGTNFDGSGNITTSGWGTARMLTIGDTGKSVDGSAGVTWSLAEIGAAPTAAGVYYVDGGGATGVWTGSISGLGAYYDGLTIAFKIGVAGAATTTLNINALGAVTCRRNTGNLTTHLPVGTVVVLTYTTISAVGYWVWADYVDGTESYTIRWTGAGVIAGEQITQYKIIMMAPDGRFYPIATGNSTAANAKTVNTQPFVINSPILINGSASTYNENATVLSTNIYQAVSYTSVFNYNQNVVTGWLANRAIYLKGAINNDGLFVLAGSGTTDGDFMTQTLPVTEDGFVYIMIGMMYNTTSSFRIFPANTILEFKDGKLRPYTADRANATHTGDATGATALTVVGINGVLLSGLGTGILKNTTGTGVPSVAIGSDFPTLNQNTTGNAATATTAAALTTGRTINGVTFDGTSNINIGSLYDTNGNESLSTVTAANAVNHLDLTNSATGNEVLVSTAGSDTNINLRIATKGTGSVTIDTGTGAGVIDLKPGSSNVRIWDDDASHYVQLITGNLTANRSLTFASGGATTLVAGTMVAAGRSLTVAGTASQIVSSAGAQNLSSDRTWTLSLADIGTPGTYTSVTTDAKGRVTAGTNPTTLAGYGITDALAFRTIAVSGQSSVVADSSDDTLTMAAGDNVTITTDDITKTVTIAATGGGPGGSSKADIRSMFM